MQRLIADIREIWQYRELLYMLVVRDLKARYKGSVLGVAWSFLQPLGMMAVLTFAFSVINRSDGTIKHFPVFALSGLLAWNFFSSSVVAGAASVVNNAPLVKKVYFPRLVLPVSAVMSSLINFLFALPIFFGVSLAFGHGLKWTLILLPFVVLIQIVFSIGISCLLATLNVFYRDTAFIVDLSMLALFFLTPIWYDIGNATNPAVALWVRRLNPMASLVNMYQDVMYHGVPTSLDFILRTALTAIIFLVVGYLAFQRFSPRFGEEA
jgi:ABC-type polysaccharide/polyol phosphate export permease